MKKLLMVGLFVSLVLVGCESKGEENVGTLYKDPTSGVYTFIDEDTGCEYLIIAGSGKAITPRYEQAGKIKGCKSE